MGSKVRLFARRGESDDYRYLAWFKLDGSHDFSWGAPHPTIDASASPVPGGQARFTIEPPVGWEDMRKVDAHRTYHESGVMHVQASGAEHASVPDVWLGRPEEITGPSFVELLISAPFSHMEQYGRSLTRGGCRATVLTVSDELWYRRWNVELYLTTLTSTDLPRRKVRAPADSHDQQLTIMLDEDLDRAVTLRAYPAWEEFSNVPLSEHVVSMSVLPGPEFAAIEAARLEQG
ncbi:hypothetical protein ACN9MI_19970 [Rhodococcoides fascians]|jgi:hypothetical protein|uniref:hypothetical protein n=1 Tax=Rhodococcoides fascians TaxID=1828 RepID=UPI003CE9E2E2